MISWFLVFIFCSIYYKFKHVSVLLKIDHYLNKYFAVPKPVSLYLYLKFVKVHSSNSQYFYSILCPKTVISLTQSFIYLFLVCFIFLFFYLFQTSLDATFEIQSFPCTILNSESKVLILWRPEIWFKDKDDFRLFTQFLFASMFIFVN